MLHNPDWDRPSLTGFKAWLEVQDSKQEFDYSDICVCAVGQYLASKDTSWFKAGSISQDLNQYAHAAYEASRKYGNPTFGDVLVQVNRELESTG